MAATAYVYGKFLLSAVNGKVNLSSDTLKVMLCSSSYTPNQDTHQYKSDVTNEVTGTGYTAGGATLTTVTATYNAGTNTLVLDADDVEWTDSTITARYAVVYDATPSTDATRPLIMVADFGQDVSSSLGPFDLNWNASGIVNLTASAA